ncbi:MAG: hypothetical protein K2Y39_08030 [Candidatus Obscuribacterales bacterium]|nr:hypothetical protein [Candidatus Obscuribacterales bacterium]
MNKLITKFAFTALTSASLLAGTAAFAGNTVTAKASLDLPDVVSLSGTDNVTTVQELKLDSSNISFDSNLNASGDVRITWKGNSNSNKGFQVTVQRSAISGSASNELQNDLAIYGAPASGGDTDAVINGNYASGIALPQIPEGKPDLFASTNKAGSALFDVGMKLNAASAHGKGTAQTVLTFVAASL